MRYHFLTLPPGQFGIRGLFVLTTVAAICFAVVRLPGPLPEKIMSLLMLCRLFWAWKNRNYLHPIQGTISLTQRRRIALVGYLGSISLLPFYILFYVVIHGPHLLFVDIVFGGTVLIAVALATWKLVRATLPGPIWVNTIEV